MQKINQKNTWELKLIDHLSEIIKVETEGDTETNFQKVRPERLCVCICLCIMCLVVKHDDEYFEVGRRVARWKQGSKSTLLGLMQCTQTHTRSLVGSIELL